MFLITFRFLIGAQQLELQMLLTPEKGPVCVSLDLTHIKMPFLQGLSSCGGWGHTDYGFVDNLLVLGK
jgi:hypothetical protein